MTTGYRDGKPEIGQEHCAFRSINAVKEFLKIIHVKESDATDFWTIHGELVRDEGGPDGLVIKVEAFERLKL
ncbi:hypothetical protein [Spirosoma foliorum]|uniref:Uncharacterized protein n=1 Tax=Spirosoma foliorum TaxID=2710596 RepID=A0A7G5GZN7_9BACT|nr:hypothetical protein [Spirosoma foliorum]QMW04329.1 hypothetical protein H3H32_05110 [Spirosoma foliorum]